VKSAKRLFKVVVENAIFALPRTPLEAETMGALSKSQGRPTRTPMSVFSRASLEAPGAILRGIKTRDS
jgi:hypothetical protein